MSSSGARRRQILFSSVLATVGIALALLAGELMLRLVAPPLFEHQMRIYDPELGWRAKPSTVLYRPTGKAVRFDTNSVGFRDREHHPAQMVGGANGRRSIRRIMIFGDSFTESAQVEIHETFWSLLKDRLNASQDEIYWEVHCFGIGDWGTTQEWLAYKEYGKLADLVILQVFPLNDIANNSIDAANLASSQDAYRPYLDPANGFRSITYLNPRTTWLRQNSRLARFLIQTAIAQRGTWGREQVFDSYQDRVDYSDQRARELGMGEDLNFPAVLFNSLAYDPEQFEVFRTGWRATDTAVRRFVNLSKARSARFMVLVVPHLDQLQPHSKKLDKLPFKVHATYGERRIRNLLAGDGVPVVGLVEDFEANIQMVTPYLEGHFNRPTHHLVAERLEAEVLKLFPEDGTD